MSTNFGFGNLTSNGQKIDWNTVKKYDTDGDGKISTSEYNAMIKELDSDGFNGITAFGKMDGNSDGQITEDEFSKVEQQVKMGEYADQLLESMDSSERTSSLVGAVSTFVSSYSAAYLAKNKNDSSSMYTQFTQDLAIFISGYKSTMGNIEALKGDTTLGASLVSTVNDANSNGYVSSTEAVAVKKAAGDYALSQALKGDYTFLTNMGVNASKLTTLKNLVASLATSTDPTAAIASIKSAINTLIANVATTKVVSATATLETTLKAEEVKKNSKSPSAYTVDGMNLDYSSIDGYNENKTVTVKKAGEDGANDLAKAAIEKLRAQLKSVLEAQCKTAGVALDEALFTSIFDAAETVTIESSVSGKHSTAFRHSSSSFDTKTLVDNFVTTFNTKMKETIDKLNASQTDSNGVPTLDSLKTSYLDDDDSKLTKDQVSLKNIQKDILSGSTTKVKKSDAKNAIVIFAADLASQMIAKLGIGSTNMINNLIDASIQATMDEIPVSAFNRSVITVDAAVTKFYEKFQAKYSEYKSKKSA